MQSRPTTVRIKALRHICAGVLISGTIAGACSMTPDGHFAFDFDPSFFTDSAAIQLPQPATAKNAHPGEVTVPLPKEITRGISSLKEKSAKEFNGYQAQSLVGLIGRPDFVRRDGPAQIWQYRSNACILDLFMYGATTDKTVKHAELRGGTIGKGPSRGCFAKLLHGRTTHKHASARATDSSL
jgi:hypothetical protein